MEHDHFVPGQRLAARPDPPPSNVSTLRLNEGYDPYANATTSPGNYGSGATRGRIRTRECVRQHLPRRRQTPPSNESWDWSKHKVSGVNLGGWLVLEPSTPRTTGFAAMSQVALGTLDRGRANYYACAGRASCDGRVVRHLPIALHTFSPSPIIHPYAVVTTLLSCALSNGLAEAMRADRKLEEAMDKHHDEFITEEDIAQIAGAGLNWVRAQIPFWEISTWTDVGVDETGKAVIEPYWAGDRLLGWARKYGIRVNLDLHTAPGLQNGYNHSGKGGQINFLNGPMGIANAQRMLDYIRVIAEFISQPEYADVVPMFGIINEGTSSFVCLPFMPHYLRPSIFPRAGIIGIDQLTALCLPPLPYLHFREMLTSWTHCSYLEAHNMVRGITGIGKGPYISIHDGFNTVASWAGFLPGSDRIILDTHPYFAFSGGANTAPIATGTDPDNAGGQWPPRAHNAWGASINNRLAAEAQRAAEEAARVATNELRAALEAKAELKR
ncbi:glycoside hydrolase superfamily [Mycena rebaudengoi]|nr:glycoside hydrolase superfamily [Mycena rebaudengoi]